MATEIRGCSLCNNPYSRNYSVCDVCGGHKYKLFKVVPIGYIYPYEARIIKRLVIVLLVLFFLAIILYLVWDSNLDTQIERLQVTEDLLRKFGITLG